MKNPELICKYYQDGKCSNPNIESRRAGYVYLQCVLDAGYKECRILIEEADEEQNKTCMQ